MVKKFINRRTALAIACLLTLITGFANCGANRSMNYQEAKEAPPVGRPAVDMPAPAKPAHAIKSQQAAVTTTTPSNDSHRDMELASDNQQERLQKVADIAPLPTATPAPEYKRIILKNGEIDVTVKTYEPFYNELQKEINLFGGYISQIDDNKAPTGTASAQVTIRIAPDKLDTFIAFLKQQGNVTGERLKAEDVSEQYYDLKARLDNARKFEERLLDMLKTKTGSLSDVVLVEEKLNQVREQIEEFEGKIKYYDNLAAMATITINIRVQENFVPSSAPGFGDQVGTVWHDSIRALKDTTQFILLVVVALIPWAIPFVIFIGLMVVLYKFVKRSRSAQ